MEEQTNPSNDTAEQTIPKQETTLEEEETSPPQDTSADPLTQIADALSKLLVARSPREIDVSPYDGTFEAQSFFDNFDAQADRTELTYTDRLRKLPCYLQDTIAGFSKYGHSKTYLHVIVDHLTRYAWTFPSKSTSTLTYIQTLKTVLQQGSPKRLLSDRAPAFTSEKFRKFLIMHAQTPANQTAMTNPAEKKRARREATRRLLAAIIWQMTVALRRVNAPQSETGFRSAIPRGGRRTQPPPTPGECHQGRTPTTEESSTAMPYTVPETNPRDPGQHKRSQNDIPVPDFTSISRTVRAVPSPKPTTPNQGVPEETCELRTISRRLVANGLHSCRPLRRLPLTPPNRRQRLEWCRARSTWMTEWHRVVFSDESRFCLSSDSRRVRVWRRHGERSNPAAIVERPTVRQRGNMVWGAIAYDSRSPLLRIQATMTAQRYVDDVLRPVTLPYLQGVPNALYQQDNARPHTARISQQALKDVQMLPWPTYSPDLSPIEHVWDIIGRRLHALPQPRSEDELWQMVEREWRAISQDVIRTLIDSLPRRVAACIAVRGGPTCY
ncbi:Transposase [Cordylochernes scorpioides]|uniref:Transposase n=1 Tax=Cordylochernes scorpioides TaxID=51811 RepID=A0ABY6KP40_9ARAC|nr:Transposase [Cordylochernes scorpioides]